MKMRQQASFRRCEKGSAKRMCNRDETADVVHFVDFGFCNEDEGDERRRISLQLCTKVESPARQGCVVVVTVGAAALVRRSCGDAAGTIDRIK